MSFDGFRPAAFDWFAGLEADNSRDWFHAHRAAYDAEVRGPLEELLQELAGDAPVWIARPNRDLRFAKDKSRPYKDRCYGTIDGRLYAQISGEGLFAGTGAYSMSSEQLSRYRAAVDDEASGRTLVDIVSSLETDGIETFGAVLRTAPRGFTTDHPRAELLRHKLLIAGASVVPDASGGLGRDAALDHLRDTWTACAPLLAWLDEHALG